MSSFLLPIAEGVQNVHGGGGQAPKRIGTDVEEEVGAAGTTARGSHHARRGWHPQCCSGQPLSGTLQSHRDAWGHHYVLHAGCLCCQHPLISPKPACLNHSFAFISIFRSIIAYIPIISYATPIKQDFFVILLRNFT